MSAPFPTVVWAWPVPADTWVTTPEGARHFVPAGGGVMAACRQVMPPLPLVAFPDLDADCCASCLRVVFRHLLPTLTRRP